jgi:hypothetical protein
MSFFGIMLLVNTLALFVSLYINFYMFSIIRGITEQERFKPKERSLEDRISALPEQIALAVRESRHSLIPPITIYDDNAPAPRQLSDQEISQIDGELTEGPSRKARRRRLPSAMYTEEEE